MSNWWNYEQAEEAFWQEFGETSHHIVPQQDGNTRVESDNILWTKDELAFCSSPIGVDGSLPHASSEVLPPVLGSKCEYSAKNINVTSEWTVDNNQYCSLSLDGISAADNGLNYMENNKAREDDLFYYELSDISNVEDLDEILRNCDSTYEERTNNTQSLLSSSYVSERTSNSNWQSSPPEFKTINSTSSCLSANSLTRNGQFIMNEQSYRDYQFVKLDSATDQMYDVGRGTGLESAVTHGCNDYGFKNVNNTIDMHIEQYEGQKSFVEGNNQSQICTSSRSVSIPSHMDQYADQKYFPSNFSSEYSFQPSGQQNSFLGSEFPGYLPYAKPPLQDQSSFPLHEDLFMHTVLKETNDLSQKAFIEKQGAGSLRQMVSVEKHHKSMQDTAKDMKMILEGGATESFARSSSIPSVHLDDISSQNSRFKQLQNVMGQLDVRTKLCIRDSLYRLARSAEQRNCITNGVSDHINGANGTRKQMNSSRAQSNVETDTNPIDRSVAHLLFHRPSEIAAESANPMITKQIDGQLFQNDDHLSAHPWKTRKLAGRQSR